MKAGERLALVRLKVERAEKHFSELEAAIQAFLATKPYRVKKIDPQVVYEIGQADPVPDCIGAIVGDVVQNLRSALDHLSRQLMLVALRVEASDRESNFPIKENAGKYESKLQELKEKRLLRDDAFNALRVVQAYKGGKGNALWVLNRLNNIDKHRVILTTGASLRSVNLFAALSRMHRATFVSQDGRLLEIGGGGRPLRDPPIVNGFFRPADIQCPLKVGDKLLVGMEMDPDNDFRFDISLNEPEVTKPQPILETVKEFTDAVGGTLSALRSCLA
jgi:hypothetical protein